MRKYIPLSKKLAAWSIPVIVALAFAGCTIFQSPAEKEDEKKEQDVNDELSVTENEGSIVKYDPDEEAENAEGEITGTSEDIILGRVDNDQAELEELQAKVDAGKDGWRLDPEQVLIAYKEDFGFYPADKYALVQKTDPQSGQGEQYIYAIQHGQESYIVSVVKAFPDKDNSIWIWDNVMENKPQAQSPQPTPATAPPPTPEPEPPAPELPTPEPPEEPEPNPEPESPLPESDRPELPSPELPSPGSPPA